MKLQSDHARDGAVCFILFLLPVFLFWRQTILGEFFLDGDNLLIYYPYQHFLTQQLKHGLLPLWNPMLFSGTPFLADAQVGLWYPGYALFRFLSPGRALTWTLVAHLTLCGWGAYALARSAFRLSRTAALLAGGAYSLCGFIQGHAVHLIYVMSFPYLPWFAWLVHRAALQRQARCVVAAGWCLGLQLMTGSAQFAYYTALFAMAVAPATLPSVQSARRRAAVTLGIVVCAGVIALSASACQSLPSWELSRWSLRGADKSLEFAGQYSLPPEQWMRTQFAPWSYGSFTTEYRGQLPLEECVTTLGAAVSVLAVAGAIAGMCAGRAALVAVAVLSLLMSFGAHVAGFGLWSHLVSPLHLFRVPARAMLLFSLAAALLAGAGLDAGRAEPRRVGGLVTGLAAVYLVFTLLAPWSLSLDLPHFALAAAVPAFFAVVTACLGLRERPRTAPRLFLIAAFAELLLLSTEMQFARTVRRRIDAVPVRAAEERPQPAAGWRAMTWAYPAATQAIRDRHSEKGITYYEIVYVAYLEALHPNLGMVGGYRTITGHGYNVQLLKQYEKFYHIPLAPLSLTGRLLDLLGVRYVLAPTATRDDLRAAGLRLTGGWWSENEDYLPPAVAAVEWQTAGSSDQAFQWLASGQVDPRRTVLVTPRDAGGMTAWGGGPAVTASATVTARDCNRLVVRTRRDTPGPVLINQTWLPGWRLQERGALTPTTLLRADVCLQAFQAPAGEHVFDVVYCPTSVETGVFISLVMLLLSVAVASALLAGRFAHLRAKLR